MGKGRRPTSKTILSIYGTGSSFGLALTSEYEPSRYRID